MALLRRWQGFSVEFGPSANVATTRPEMREPRWVRSHETSMCMLCEQKFGLKTPKHHCRSCGVLKLWLAAFFDGIVPMKPCRYDHVFDGHCSCPTGWAICGGCSANSLFLDRWLLPDKPHDLRETRSIEEVRGPTPVLLLFLSYRYHTDQSPCGSAPRV